LSEAHPEVNDAATRPVLEKADQWLSRFSSLPRSEQPTLQEAYEAVMATKWRDEATAARQAANAPRTEQRRSAAAIQRPQGASPGVESTLDVRKAPNDRTAFQWAMQEAERLSRLV